MKDGGRVAKGSFLTLLFGFANKFIAFLYTIMIARAVAPADVGAYYLVLGLLGLAYSFTDLGMTQSIGRYVPYLYGKKERRKFEHLIKMVYVVGGGLTFIASLVVFFFAQPIASLFNQPSVAPLLQTMAFFLFLKEVSDINKGILNGRIRILEFKGLELGENVLKFILTMVAFYFIGLNVQSLAAGLLVSFFLSAIVGFWFVQKDSTLKPEESARKPGEKLPLFEKEEKNFFLREVLLFGITVMLLGALDTVFQYTDRVLIGYFMGDALEQVAIYSIALGLAYVVLIFPSAINVVSSPLISELYGRGELVEMNRIAMTSMKWIIMAMFPSCLLMCVFAQPILDLFYGPVYAQGAMVLVLFTAALFVRSIFTMAAAVLMAMKRVDIELRIGIASALLNLLLSIWMIKFLGLGINGAALASFVSICVSSLLLLHYSRKIAGFKFPREAFKPLVAGIVSLLLIWLTLGPVFSFASQVANGVVVANLGDSTLNDMVQKSVKIIVLAILFIFDCLVYLAILVLMRSFGKDEFDILSKVLKKAGVENYEPAMRAVLGDRPVS